MTDKLRPLLREENEKKKLKNIKVPVKKFVWGPEYTEIFEDIKKVVTNIAKLNYYDPARETRVKCDASHSGLRASLEQQTENNDWVPFASRYLNNQEKKYSTNKLELLAVVWAVDRFKHYLLGKEFVIVTDQKALTSALEDNRSNKTYQSRLTRWMDRFLPYQFKIVHIPGKDMGIVDNLSRTNRRAIIFQEITETTFHRTCRIGRGTLDRSGSDSLDEDNFAARAVMWDQDAVKTKNLISIWDLVRQDKEFTGNIRELEAATQMITSSPRSGTRSNSPAKSIIEVDLTAEDDDNSQDVSAIQSTRGVNKRQTKLDDSLADMSNVGNSSLSKLFDKTLLAELISEDVWMDRLRRVIERKDRAGFELMGPYTNPLWNQLSVVDDCILVDNRLAVPIQLRPAVMKRIHRGHPGQEVMLDVSNYLWWLHMHKKIVNLAEECRECTRYGKNAKYILPKILRNHCRCCRSTGRRFS